MILEFQIHIFVYAINVPSDQQFRKLRSATLELGQLGRVPVHSGDAAARNVRGG